MICKKCGNQLQEGALFCGGCGSMVEKEPEQSYEVPQEPAATPGKPAKPKMKKSKKILLAVIAGVLVLVIAAGAIFLSYYFSAEQKLLRALEEDDYDAALDIYREEMEGEESDALVEKLEERLNAVRENFTGNVIDYEAATAELDSVRSMKVREVNTLLEEVAAYVETLNNSRTAFENAESFMRQEKYEEAMDWYLLVDEIDSNYATAQSQVIAAQDAYRNDILADAALYAEGGFYVEAIAQIETGLKVLPRDTVLTEQKTLYETAKAEQEIQNLLDQAAAYVAQGDYPQAIQLLRGHETNAELNTTCKKYCQDYEAALLNQANTLIAEKKYDDAILLLNRGLTVLANNENLIAKRDEAEAKKPVSITSLTPINGYWAWNEGNPEDPFGNSYSTSCNYYIFSEHYEKTTSIEYRLYGKYGEITGRIAPYTEMGQLGSVCVKIYADDVLVYTSEEVVRKMDAFTFSVNVANAEYILIEICGLYDDWNEGPNSVIISDIQLWPLQ